MSQPPRPLPTDQRGVYAIDEDQPLRPQVLRAITDRSRAESPGHAITDASRRIALAIVYLGDGVGRFAQLAERLAERPRRGLFRRGL